MLKSILKDTAIYGVADFFFKFVNFATFPIFAHLFTTDQFGVFFLATTLASLIAVLFNCGLNNAVQRHYMDPQTTKEEQPVYVTTGLLCLIGLSILIGSLALGITYYYREAIYTHNQLPWVLIAIAIIGTLPNQIFQFCVDLIRIYFKPWRFTLLSGLQNALSISLSLFFVLYWEMGIEGYLLGVVLSFTVVIPLSLWSIRQSLTLQFSWKMSKKLLAFGYPFIFAGIAYWIFASMDRWMLAEMSGVNEVGIYSTAFKLGTVLIFINTAFGRAWSPHALKIYKIEANYKNLYSYFLNLWFFFLLWIATGLSLFGNEILRYLTPESYWPAAELIPFIAFGLVFCGTTQITAIGITLEKRTVHLTIATWLTAGINFFMNLLLIPFWGAKGAAIATLFSYFSLTAYYLICTQYFHPLPLNKLKIVSCFVMIPSSLLFSLWAQSLPLGLVTFLVKTGFLALLLGAGELIGIYRISDILRRYYSITVTESQ